MKYTLITTDDGSNPGDSLLTENAKQILNKVFADEGCECAYEFGFTEKPENCIDKINSTDICFITTISYDEWARVLYYKLIKQIKIPIITLASSFAIQRFEFPREYRLNDKQKEIIEIVNKYSEIVPVRDIFSKYLLDNSGIKNVKVVGDLGCFNFGNPILKMKQPVEIKKILITAGHQPVYRTQLIDVVYYLSTKFPEAEFTYSSHTLANKTLDFSKTKCKNINIKTVNTSGHCDKLDFYKDFDLHVGYRLHGHIKSLSVGVPSILISEDSRGLGQKYTLNNIGAFTAFEFDLKHTPEMSLPSKVIYKNIFERIFSIKYIYDKKKKSIVVTLCGIKFTKSLKKKRVKLRDGVKSSKMLIREIDKHIETSIYTNWIFYSSIPTTINTLYQNSFLPFLKISVNNALKDRQNER